MVSWQTDLCSSYLLWFEGCDDHSNHILYLNFPHETVEVVVSGRLYKDQHNGMFSVWLGYCGTNKGHSSYGNFPQRSAVVLRAMCLPTAARAGLPALGQQGLPVTLTPCSTVTITPLQTLCQDTVVTQPWASVPPLSNKTDGWREERRRGREDWLIFKACAN